MRSRRENQRMTKGMMCFVPIPTQDRLLGLPGQASSRGERWRENQRSSPLPFVFFIRVHVVRGVRACVCGGVGGHVKKGTQLN